MSHFKKADYQSYGEIPQQSIILFALALQEKEDADIVEKFYPVKCRDFFNEIVWKQWTGKDYSIWGFSSKNFPVVKDEIIYLTCHGINKKEYPNYKELLEKFDSNISVSYTDNVMLVRIPKCYIQYTFLISYLTFYIRCIERFPNAIFDHTSWTGNEKNYASSIAAMTKKSMEDIYNAFKEFVSNTDYHFKDHCGTAGTILGVGDNHDCTGIVAVLTNPKNLFRQFAESFWKKEKASV